MLNFTVGPVMSSKDIIEIAYQSTPYFRTSEFSDVMLKNEQYILEMIDAPKGSRCVFLTASGTGAMESCVMNVLNDEDKVIVVNGGSFGQRFVDLCKLHKRKYTEVKCDFGRQLTYTQLVGLEEHTALLVNMHETSSGLLYDMKMISDFCKAHNILLIVDAISAFIADELDMEILNAAVVITGSQKALAVQPGVSLVVLAPSALKRVEDNPEICMYLSMKEALKNGERGQTPFTPAVITLLQIHKRLQEIHNRNGLLIEQNRIKNIATVFREKIKKLPLELVAESPSNAVTALHPIHNNARGIVKVLKDEYQIWVCPNGGEKADEVFRVGHIGYITQEDLLILIEALSDMNKRKLL